MTRPSLRRTPMMERLETRQVLSTVAPTADKQYALELINLARTNPQAAAQRLTSNLDANVEATLDHYNLKVGNLKNKIASTAAKPPLAYSGSLDSIAQGQSDDQAAMGQQTHLDRAGRTLDQRLDAIGYSRSSSGENTYAYAESNDHAIEAFAFDWGNAEDWHFRTMFEPDKGAKDAFNEVGIGITQTSNKGLGPEVITHDFASRRNANPQILGVVYQDSDRDNFYTPGEGKGGVTIEATNLSTGQKFSTQTGDAGGYQMEVAPNASYRVTDKINGAVVKSQDVAVTTVNEKVDFVLTDSPAKSSASTLAPQLLMANPIPVQPVQAVQAVQAVEPAPQISQAPAHPAWLGKWSEWRTL